MPGLSAAWHIPPLHMTHVMSQPRFMPGLRLLLRNGGGSVPVTTPDLVHSSCNELSLATPSYPHRSYTFIIQGYNLTFIIKGYNLISIIQGYNLTLGLSLSLGILGCTIISHCQYRHWGHLGITIRYRPEHGIWGGGDDQRCNEV